MKKQLTAQDIPALTEYMAGKMTAQKNALAKLDSLTGDGDMGVTVVLAFKAMTRACKRTGGMGIGEVFALFSEEVGENAPLHLRHVYCHHAFGHERGAYGCFSCPGGGAGPGAGSGGGKGHGPGRREARG